MKKVTPEKDYPTGTGKGAGLRRELNALSCHSQTKMNLKERLQKCENKNFQILPIFKKENVYIGTGEMAQSVKCLMHMYKDLNSDALAHIKCWNSSRIVIPVLGRGGQEVLCFIFK